MEQQTQQTAGLLVAVVLQLPYLILHSEKLMADELRVLCIAPEEGPALRQHVQGTRIHHW